MSRKKSRQSPKRVLRLPDLDFAKSAVLNTLRSPESKRSYRFANRLLDHGGISHLRPNLSVREQDRFRLGRRCLGKGDLVRRQGVCLESATRQPCSS
jgi:hypothetical protein